MNNGQQGNQSTGGGSWEPRKVVVEPIPDVIATPPPSRDHLTQLVFPSTSREQKDTTKRDVA